MDSRPFKLMNQPLWGQVLPSIQHTSMGPPPFGDGRTRTLVVATAFGCNLTTKIESTLWPYGTDLPGTNTGSTNDRLSR